MTVEETAVKAVKALVERVYAAGSDWEQAHSEEDTLWQFVAFAFAPDEVLELLREFRERTKDDTRWYA